MQILGLSDSTPKPENRLKVLFWPTIRHEGDLEYITEEGFWVCFIVSVVTLIVCAITRQLPLGFFDVLFFFLAGVGVRERSQAASIFAFVVYLLGTLMLGPLGGHSYSVVRIIFLALLLANIRGIWLSARWKREGKAGPPIPRLNETFFDKLSGRIPAVLWPRTKWLFYVLAILEVGFLLIALTVPTPPAAKI